MGIRFYCPKGHKLNVKEFQAGRVGICPYCGTKMQIPLKSTRPSTKAESHAAQAAAGSKAEAAPTAASTAGMVPESPAEPRPASFGAPSASAAPKPDPISEGGQSVWYVRPASGGQFGPAAPEVMRTWLAEGRVAADSLVWREGWRDWQAAENVFPELASGPTIPGMEIVLSEPAGATLHPSPLQQRRNSHATQLAVIAGLVFAIIVLFAILLVVLRQ